jgi:hypothetical protein
MRTRGSRFLDFFGFSISYSLQLMGKTRLFWEVPKKSSSLALTFERS